MHRQVAAGVAALIIGLLWLGGCAPSTGQQEALPEAPRNVRVLPMAVTDLHEYFEISGAMQPLRGTDVAAEESGTVAALPHDKGTYVRQGDVLVELDRRLLAAEVEAATASLDLAEYNAEQTQRLFEAQKVSRIQAMTARTQARQAQAALRIVRLRHDRAAIKAPFAGLVANRYVEPGQLVNPGQPVGRLVDPHVLKLVGTLTEREIVWLDRDAAARVHVDGQDQPVAGRVAWISFEADPVTGKFTVEVQVQNDDLRLRPGVVGRATILKRTHQEVLVVPRDAVMEGQMGHFVYVVQDERAHQRPIVLGADQGLLVIVRSGLRHGDQLVVRGHRDLVEGALVRVTETATARDGGLGTDPLDAREMSAAPRIDAGELAP